MLMVKVAAGLVGVLALIALLVLVVKRFNY